MKPHKTNQTTASNAELKVTFLGGLDDVGEKNMTIIEWQDQALILDCGNDLGVDLPGVNYAINDVSYLETIRHKLKAYIITHGHLDHIGGLRHIVPQFPVPIYGSRFTIGVIAKTFEELSFQPELISVDIDTRKPVRLGDFAVEFIRVTHAIPDPAAICIDTPVGRILATGDFRLDPEPLDQRPSDTARLRELGQAGILLLLSDSSYADSPGRTPTEHTLQKSFRDLIIQADGRIFVAVFSSNINRTQMIIDAAVAAGRKVALDGRSMLAYAEIAVRQGILKVPKGTITPMDSLSALPDNQILVMCTGGQGEPRAALQRMSEGEHKHVTLQAGDTVVISSSPIPGNEVRYDQISNRLTQLGVQLFRHPTYALDGCGPLHVSGHAKREELQEMIRLTQPRFFVPVHAGQLRRQYHAELGTEERVPPGRIFLPGNGDCLLLTPKQARLGKPVPHGSVYIDQAGAIVHKLVVQDRVRLGEAGIMTLLLTIDKTSGQLISSPDIISRGFIAVRDNEELMAQLRAELQRIVRQRFLRVDPERFKAELKQHITRFLIQQTRQSPLVIPVVNIYGHGHSAKTKLSPAANHKRFEAMRRQLLKPTS